MEPGVVCCACRSRCDIPLRLRRRRQFRRTTDTPASPPPDPKYSVGWHAINGIDAIPQSMVQLTREEMQNRMVVVDSDEDHASSVGRVACESYIQSGDCNNQAGKFYDNQADGTVRTVTGTSPFMKLISEHDSSGVRWAIDEMAGMENLSIAILTGATNSVPFWIGDDIPHLTIASASNYLGNSSWYDHDKMTPAGRAKIDKAVAEDRLIFVGGWDKDADGNYIRHEDSSSCKGDGIQDGCVWTPFEFAGYSAGGTSYSAPNFAAALASVLAIAPRTTPQNLARFGKACVRKSGEGIEKLLETSGGLGVADFACVGDVVTAVANLPSGGTTNVTINGQAVTLDGQSITLSFAEGTIAVSEGTDGFFFTPMRSGGGTGLFVTGYRAGDLFVLLAGGTRDDFFGFRGEHRHVRESSITAGHENLFLALAEQSSDGGRVITGARGRSLTVTARETVPLTGSTDLTLSVAADRFLGGEASIPLGTMELGESGWGSRLSLGTETAIDSATAFTTSVEVTDDGDHILMTGLRASF